jgi:antirestriction protein
MIIPNKGDQMTVTFQANYKEIFAAQTVEKVEELLDQDFDLQAIITFVDEYDEEAFVNYYEDYVEAGEAIGFEAVDALVSEDGFEDVSTAAERYQGEFTSTAEFAEYYVEDVLGERIPDCVSVDWERTWDSNFYYSHTAYEKDFQTVYIFTDF